MEEKLEKIFQDLIEDKNIEVMYVDYEKEGGYNYLRVYLEKLNDEKITLEDCEKISLKISDAADNEIKEAFFLEVSSAGLERKLKREKDFLKYIGQNINIKTKNNVENSKKFEGKLLKFVDNTIHILDKKLGEVEIPLDKVKTAKNVFDFSSFIKMEG